MVAFVSFVGVLVSRRMGGKLDCSWEAKTTRWLGLVGVDLREGVLHGCRGGVGGALLVGRSEGGPWWGHV